MVPKLSGCGQGIFNASGKIATSFKKRLMTPNHANQDWRKQRLREQIKMYN